MRSQTLFTHETIILLQVNSNFVPQGRGSLCLPLILQSVLLDEVCGAGVRAGDNPLEGTRAVRTLGHIAAGGAEGPGLVHLRRDKGKRDLTAVLG